MRATFFANRQFRAVQLLFLSLCLSACGPSKSPEEQSKMADLMDTLADSKRESLGKWAGNQEKKTEIAGFSQAALFLEDEGRILFTVKVESEKSDTGTSEFSYFARYKWKDGKWKHEKIEGRKGSLSGDGAWTSLPDTKEAKAIKDILE